MSFSRALLAAAILAASFASDALAATQSVVQSGRKFTPNDVTISAGDSVEFSNQDEFIHQIYVDSDKINYDSAEQPPGQVITIKFPTAGDFPVRCHIHPKMLLTVHVK